MLSAHYEFFDGFSFIFLCFECFIVLLSSYIVCFFSSSFDWWCWEFYDCSCEGPYLIVITNRTKVGTVDEKTIWKITGTEIIPYQRTLLHLNEQQVWLSWCCGCPDAVLVLMLCLSWCCGCLDGIECLPFYFILWPLGNWVLQMLNTCLGLLFGLANAFNWFWWPLFWNWLLLKA